MTILITKLVDNEKFNVESPFEHWRVMIVDGDVEVEMDSASSKKGAIYLASQKLKQIYEEGSWKA